MKQFTEEVERKFLATEIKRLEEIRASTSEDQDAWEAVGEVEEVLEISKSNVTFFESRHVRKVKYPFENNFGGKLKMFF